MWQKETVKKLLKPGFHMSGKSQTIGDFTVSRLSQILSTNENSKSKISPIVWDGWGQIWRIGSVPIFPTRPRFCDGRRSFPTNENSNSYRRGRRRWISHITNPLNCWAPVPLSRKFQFLAHFPFPAKLIGRIWVWLVAIIWYIWDGRQKVKSPIVWDFPDIWKPG